MKSNLTKYLDKKFLIIGLGKRTGVSLANFFHKNDIKYKITDSRKMEQLQDEIELLLDQGKNILKVTQNNLDVDDFDIFLVSPGVPLHIPIITKIKQSGKEIYNDIEFFYRLFPDNKFIAITGSDGKTTTTTLTGELLNTTFKTIVGGNIGVPIFDFYEDIDENTVILLELSSFQIDSLISFKPHISAILNYSPDHLDRYGTFEKYVESKKGIFKNQDKSDYLVLNYDNEITKELNVENTNVLFFSKFSPQAIFVIDDLILFNDEKIGSINDILLRGVHNLENVLSAILIAKLMGVDNSSILEVLKRFTGLEHRMEYVDMVNGVEFYNDSKATTVNSVGKALESFSKPINLIMGGRDKGLDFSELNDLISRKVKNLILSGDAAEKINESIDFSPKFIMVNLKQAFEKAIELSNEGDIVLLSPACTSYDEFKDYEERGRYFKNLVKKHRSLF